MTKPQDTAPTCSTCGAVDPSDNVYCSNGFHSTAAPSEPQDTAPTDTLIVARALARSHGLGDHRGDEHLKPWMRDAETAIAAMDDRNAELLDIIARARVIIGRGDAQGAADILASALRSPEPTP